MQTTSSNTSGATSIRSGMELFHRAKAVRLRSHHDKYLLAVELGRKQIRVNAICPGSIETEIDENTQDRAPEGLAPKVEFPEGEIPLTGKVPGTAEQVAELALFLASDASSHVTGAEIFIDGAQSLLQG